MRDAQPGQTLEVHIHELVPEAVGMTWVGEVTEFLPRLGIEGFSRIGWHIDWKSRTARRSSGHTVAVAPFLGVMGVAPAAPGVHSTRPPQRVGGNIDCKELTAGSTLYLPIEVPGALFSFGDGHAAQGDGEVGGTAIECGMQHVELSLMVRDTPSIAWPQADTPTGWLTFGFDENLETATVIAVNAMLDLLMQRLAVSREEALALASVVIDLRVTQIANGTLGVHARLPHNAVT
jgi:acetamidase/formamidase